MQLHGGVKSYGGTESGKSVSFTESEVEQKSAVRATGQKSHITDLTANRPISYQAVPQDFCHPATLPTPTARTSALYRVLAGGAR